ncbi:hypothetical protein NMG60_11026948 [Bertholletia excelsa]
MLGFLSSYLNDMSFDATVRGKKRAETSCVYRDELDKKSPAARRLKKAAAKDEALQKPLIQKESGKKGGTQRDPNQSGMTVKVLMTKEEAARLLSKCKQGGRLEFGDVARELARIPQSRVNVVSSSSSRDNNWVLDSIPEEHVQ